MVTLLHHIQPWMQKSIVKAEDQIEKRVAQQTEQKIQVVYQRLDTFELWVLAQPAPAINLTTLQAVVDSLRADMDVILETRGTELESATIELAEDTSL